MPSSPVPRPEGHRSFAWLGAAALVGLLLGFAAIPSAGGVRSRRELPIRLFGRLLPANASAADVALGWVNQRCKGWFNLELPDGAPRRVSYATLGVAPDGARLRQLILDAQSGVYPSEQLSIVAPDGLELIVPLRVERERLLGVLSNLKEELDRAAVDARLDLDRKAVVPEREGRWLDVDRSAVAIEQALERGAEDAALAFEARAPQRRATELGGVRYDALLGYFETSYDVATRADDRTFNLRWAASRLDGCVLMPEEVLDFNALVGPRDEAQGYRVARVIARGERLDGIGGSTGQLSGTLHAAALFAGLDILERHPDPQASAYLELGLDAAAAYPALNLRARNPYDFPIVVRATLAGGRLRAELRGARRPHTISLIRKLDAATPFERVERVDAELERGARIVAQRGAPGIDLHRYRIVRDGAHAVRQVTIERYPPTPELILVGTGSPSSPRQPDAAFTTTGRPPQGTPSEYLVDELLVVTQPAQLDGPLLEQRVPGRFGVPGWTKSIGAPAWNERP